MCTHPLSYKTFHPIPSSRWGVPVGRLFLSLAFLLVMASSVQGAELSLTPYANLQLRHDDNKRLTTAPHDAVTGRILDAKVKLALSTETSSLEITPRVRLARYSPQGDIFDTSDRFLDITAAHSTERTRLSLEANLTYDSTLTSETQETGRFLSNKRRESYNLRPAYTWEISDRNTLGVSGSYTDVSYQGTGLVGYNYGIVDIYLTRRLSETDSVSVYLYSSKYEAPDTDSTSTSVGLQGGYSHAFTETLSGTVRGGVITTKMEFLSFSNNALRQDEERVNGTFFSAGVTKQFETTTWEASASRSLSPTGSGYLSVTDEVQLEIKREFRPRWRGNLGFNIFDKGSQGDRNTSGNRRRAELSAGLSWDLSRWWRLRGDYRYVRQKYENAAEAADANRFMFSLVYHDHKRAISR